MMSEDQQQQDLNANNVQTNVVGSGNDIQLQGSQASLDQGSQPDVEEESLNASGTPSQMHSAEQQGLFAGSPSLTKFSDGNTISTMVTTIAAPTADICSSEPITQMYSCDEQTGSKEIASRVPTISSVDIDMQTLATQADLSQSRDIPISERLSVFSHSVTDTATELQMDTGSNLQAKSSDVSVLSEPKSEHVCHLSSELATDSGTAQLSVDFQQTGEQRQDQQLLSAPVELVHDAGVSEKVKNSHQAGMLPNAAQCEQVHPSGNSEIGQLEEMEVDEQRDRNIILQLGDKMAQEVLYDFSNRKVPTFITYSRSEYLTSGSENFLRGCKWSPDGQQVVTNSNDNILRIFNMSDYITDNEMSQDLEQIPEKRLREGGTIYDFAWHPAMSRYSPDCQRIATTCPGIPIHLWDSGTGKIVANYKAFDQYDEITAAYSVAFNPSGEKIVGGYKKAIRIFDTEYPTRRLRLIKTCGSKKSMQPSQPGIISCFSYDQNNPVVFAAGSYSGHVGLYDLRTDGMTCVMEGQRSGVTQLMFTPDGSRLITGARKDKEMHCWDIRNLGYTLFTALRDVRTNQRMQFDITRCGRYMTSGNDDGTVTFWDLQRPVDVIRERPYLRPVGQFQAHADSVNGVSFHRDGLLLASASGQRHFRTFDDSIDDSDDSDEDVKPFARDFSLQIWRMPCLAGP